MRYIIEDALIPILVFIVIMTFFVGLGFMAYHDDSRRHELKLACINSGGSLVSGNCLRAGDLPAVQ